MTQHTPAPWKLSKGSSNEYHLVGIPLDDSHTWLDLEEAYAAFDWGQLKEHWGEVGANARLIAAAPDMYTALQHVIIAMSIGNPIDMMEAHAECRTALRKAAGDE